MRAHLTPLMLLALGAAILMAGCGGGGGGGGDVTAPSTPIEPQVAAASSTSVTFSWTDTAANETGFEVQRETGGVWATIGQTAQNVTTYTDTGLTAGTLYGYRVRALGSGANSSWTTEVQIAPGTAAPTAPSSLRSSNLGTDSVTLLWDDNSSTETGFELQRQPSGGAWITIASLAANTTSYADTGLSGNSAYNYRVRSVRYGVGSVRVGPLAITTLNPGAVGSVTGTVRSWATGLVISGATVAIGTRSVTTGANGSFTLTSVPDGVQTLTVTASGYNKFTGSVTVVASGTVSVGDVNMILTGDGPPPPPF